MTPEQIESTLKAWGKAWAKALRGFAFQIRELREVTTDIELRLARLEKRNESPNLFDRYEDD